MIELSLIDFYLCFLAFLLFLVLIMLIIFWFSLSETVNCKIIMKLVTPKRT
nr:ORF7b [Severe acute respiratory syndrome coronavirus 2]